MTTEITYGLFKGEGLSYTTFGRIRPLHTNAVVFAFVGNMVFAGVYYSTQRLCKARTASDLLSKIHFWGWQLIIHFWDPRQTSPGSNMPTYPFLFENRTDFKSLPEKIAVQSRLGVPWPAMGKDEIEQNARDQALEIARSLVTAGAFIPTESGLTPDELRRKLSETQVVALIAYMQKVGTYELKERPAELPATPDNFHRESFKTQNPTPKEEATNQ